MFEPKSEANAAMVPVTEGSIAATPDEVWQQTTAVFDLAPVNTGRHAEAFLARTWSTNLCIFAQNDFGANVHHHTQKHIRKSGGFVVIHRYLRGVTHGRTEGEPFAIMPGRIAIRDYGAAFEAVQSRNVFQGVLVPYPMLGFRPGMHPKQLFFDADTTFGRKFHAQLDHFFSSLLAGQTSVSLARLRRFISCLKLALNQGNVERDVRTQARQALAGVIKHFIELHLASPDLSTALLLREFGVSRATLFRIFAPYGGVRNYISNRRMARAIFQIAQAPSTRGQISRASSDWGFSSDSNFNRAVHRQFGAPPSALFWQPLKKLSQRHLSANSLNVLLRDLTRQA